MQEKLSYHSAAPFFSPKINRNGGERRENLDGSNGRLNLQKRVSL